jgi:hypothetical protein
MQRLEVSGAVRRIYGSLGAKGLIKQIYIDGGKMFRLLSASHHQALHSFLTKIERRAIDYRGWDPMKLLAHVWHERGVAYDIRAIPYH